MKEIFTVGAEFSGERLDSFIAKVSDFSRSAVQKAIDEGRVTVDGKAAPKKLKVAAGMSIEIETTDALSECDAIPEDIPLDIVYEDDSIIVINKPKGMVVHPAAGNYTGTLVNGLLFHCKDSLSGIGGVARPGIVHRIDKDTSGLLVVAKTDAAHTFLSDLLKDHSISRIYYAVAVGTPRETCGTINKPIGRHKTDRKKMAVYASADAEGVREAVTHYKVLASNGGYSLIKFKLETGRTHQIRVHMASIGHPLLCDTVYGGGHTQYEKINEKRICGQALLAKELDFIHPETREAVHFEVELPDYFQKVIKDLGLDDYKMETGF